MPIITGKGVVYGAAGTFVIGAVSIDSANRSLEYTHSFDMKEIQDSQGEVQSLVGTKEMNELSVEFVPSGDSLAEAQQMANDSAKPGILDKVTLSAFSIDFLNGDWSYVGGAKGRLTNDDVFVVTIPLKRYPGNLADVVT